MGFVRPAQSRGRDDRLHPARARVPRTSAGRRRSRSCRWAPRGTALRGALSARAPWAGTPRRRSRRDAAAPGAEAAAPEAPPPPVSQRRITIVASELLGRAGTGGAGTADSLLGIALARHGHAVRLLIASGREIGTLSPEWLRRYDAANVEIHVLDRIERVRPTYLAPALEVFHALREDPPEVAIVNDWRGLGFLAQRARQTGLVLEDTAFVVHCHSPGRVLTEFAQKVPDTLDRFGEQVM